MNCAPLKLWLIAPLNHPKIEILWDSEIIKIEGDKIVRSVTVLNHKTKKQASREAAGVFFAIGHKPTPISLGANLRRMNKVISSSNRDDPSQMWRAYLPLEMFRIRSTVRRSRRPAQVVWLPLMPKDGFRSMNSCEAEAFTPPVSPYSLFGS